MKHIKTYKIFENTELSENLYHGTRKGDFPPEKRRFAEGSIFLTTNLDFAKNFAEISEKEEFPNSAVFQIWLNPNVKICDSRDKEIMKQLDLFTILNELINSKYIDDNSGIKFGSKMNGSFKGYDYNTDKESDIDFSDDNQDKRVYYYLWRIKNGAWRIIETESIIKKIKQSGYDGFFVEEKGSKNVAIFSDKSIKKFEKIL